MSPVGTDLLALVESAARRLRRDGALAAAALVAAGVPLVLLLAWAVADWGTWTSPGPWPMVLWGVVLVGGGVLLRAARRRDARRFARARVAREAERGLTLPDGALGGLLELQQSVPGGTSPALYRHAVRALEGRVTPTTDLRGQLGARTRRERRFGFATLALLVLLAAGLALVAPQRARAGWSPLLHPLRHLTPPPLPPLVVRPGTAEVPRGQAVTVEVDAVARDAVTLHWQAAGDVPAGAMLAVREGRASGALPPLDATTRYWVEAPDGARSPEYHLTPVDPLLLQDLEVEVVYPAYLERPSDRYGADVPPLELPEGTRLLLRGRASRQLSSLALVHEATGTRVDVPVDGEAFRGAWTPRRSGTWGWALDGPAGAAAVAPPPLEIRLLADAPPTVSITFPGTDTVLDPTLTQVVAADARDDHGVAAAKLVSWRVRASGGAGAPVEQTVPVTLAGGRLALRALLDARERDLLPGDTLKVQVRVTDDSPGAQTGTSRVLSLYLPTAAEQRRQVLEETAAALDDAAELAREAGRVGQATRGVERRTAAGNARRGTSTGGGGTGAQQRGGMDFAQAEEARQVLDRQADLMGAAEELQARVEALQRAMEAAGLEDPALRQRLEELRRLYDEALTPEMREQLQQLRDALDALDPEAVERALRELAAEQEAFEQQMERSAELLRQAAAEQQMNALAQEARELATQQQALAEAMRQEGADSARARGQEALEERGGALAEALRKLQQALGEQREDGAGEQAGKAAEAAERAGDAQRQAGDAARQGDGERAGEQGSEAAERLGETADRLDEARRGMADRWRDEARESVEQATNDALSLAQRQNELLERMRQEQAGQAGGQQPPQPPQGAQQQSGQQQGGQQQGGQQQGGQQQGGQQQGGQQQGGQQQGGQQQGGQQQGGQQQGGQQQGGGSAGEGGGLASEQAALQQGLEQLSRNLTEAGQRTALMDPSVGSALGRANLSMEQTMEALRQSGGQGVPQREAERTLDALNRLALSLLESSQRMESSSPGAGDQQALEQLTELAQQQGNLNGQTQSLSAMDLSAQAMQQQMRRLAEQQREIAGRLSGVNDMAGGAESVLGQLDALAREADQLAAAMAGDRVPPELLARQERLFHRLLDAGRSLERDETSEERQGERAGAFDPRTPGALAPALLEAGGRFQPPTAAELEAVPPALRRLILDYFERLNRRPPAGGVGGGT